MKRFIIWIIAIVCGLVILLAGFTGWVVGTDQGTRWLLNKVLKTVSTQVTVGHIDGNPASKLTLSDIKIENPKRKLIIEKASLSIEPLYLLSGHIGINDLQLQNIILFDKALKAPPSDLIWPHLPQRFLFLTGSVKKFQIDNFSYKDRGGELIKVEFIQGKADWLLGALTLKEIYIRSSLGEITGSAKAGFIKPLLSGNLQFLPLKPLFDHERFDLQMKAVKPQTGEQISSDINLTAFSMKNEHFRAVGNIGLKKTGIPFHNVQIQEMNRHGYLLANGELILSGYDPRFALLLKIQDLALEKDESEAKVLKNSSSQNAGSQLDKAWSKLSEFFSNKKSQYESKGKTGKDLRRVLPASISGTVSLNGSFQIYKGNFSLQHKSPGISWLTGQLQGQITGDKQSIRLEKLAGNILGGTVTGDLDWDWHKTNQLSWTLQGCNLDPTKIGRELEGRINADARGSFTWDEATPLAGDVRINLIKSTLNKRTLEGSLDARFGQNEIMALQGYVRGKGFQISVKGKPADILNYRINVTELSGLVPEVRGQMKASGWVRLTKKELTGLLKGSGNFPIGSKVAIHIARTELQWVWNKKGLTFGWNATLDPAGKIEGSFTSAEPFNLALPKEGNLKATWHSIDPGFIKYWYDKDINIQGKLNGKLKGSLRRGTVAAAQGDVFLSNGRLSWNRGKNLITTPVRRASLNFTWEHNTVKGNLALNLADYGHLDGDFQLPLLSGFPLRMADSGAVRLQVDGALHEKGIFSRIFPENIAKSHGKAKIQISATGTWAKPDFRGWAILEEFEVTVLLKESKAFHDKGTTYHTPRTELQWTWNEKGLQAGWNIELNPSGQIKGSFTSHEPFHFFSLPEEGKIQISWNSIDPAFINHLYKKSVNIQGKLNGALQGGFHKDTVFAEGDLAINDGKLTWDTGKGVITTAIRQASLNFLWQNNAIKGKLVIRLAEYGHVNGNFQLPLLSHFPLRMVDAGALRFQVSGALREKGILSALFPGSVAESHGKLNFQVTAGGTWAKPDFRGWGTLEEAGAYFPQAGIRLDNAAAQAEWIGDRINIQSFRFRSGTSELHGSATLWIAAGTISHYEGAITGEKIRAVYLPEIRIWASPDLRFSGDLNKMSLRGSVRIPEALISYSGKSGLVTASSDVIIVDQQKKKKKSLTLFPVDTNISISLGDKFSVEAEGLHAKLGGRITVKGSRLDNLLLDGQIEIVKGYYEHYGTRLNIASGRAVFKEEPADRGSLYILALKKIRDAEKGIDVEAGVIISGTVRSPLVKLYSRPAMSDQDILSYLVIGKPYNVNTGSSQKEQMTEWAAAVLGGGSSSFTKKIKEKLGVNIGVESGSKGGVTSSLVTVGKYLSPDLYIAVGRSVFGDDYYLSARYSFLKHWQVETKVGLHSATDLFYRIEFD
ncbi:MAG: translocation/assembly module TamB domain-containing protein [Smithella sp.]